MSSSINTINCGDGTTTYVGTMTFLVKQVTEINYIVLYVQSTRTTANSSITLTINNNAVKTINVPINSEINEIHFSVDKIFNSGDIINISTSRYYCNVLGGAVDNKIMDGSGLMVWSNSGYQMKISTSTNDNWYMGDDGYAKLLNVGDIDIFTKWQKPKPWFGWKSNKSINNGYPYVWGFESEIAEGNIYLKTEDGIVRLIPFLKTESGAIPLIFMRK